MKRNVLKTLAGISFVSLLATASAVYAEDGYIYDTDTVYYDGSDDYYYDDSNYYYDDSNNYYDDSSYYYDDSNNYYDDSSYYYDDSNQYYDDSSYYYDDSEYYGSDDYSYSEPETAAAEEPEAEETEVKKTKKKNKNKNKTSNTTLEKTSYELFAHPEPRYDITRGNNDAREKANAEGKVHSYLTGKLIDQELAFSRPVAVMINNIIDALPQAGISKAAVIYECPVEGEITRMMAIFEDVTGIDKIGPVRSCRDYYIDLATEFDAIYVHFGQAVYAYDLLNSDMVNNISGLEYQDAVGAINGYAGEDIFYRTDDRPSPHNCYTSETGITTAIDRKGYDMDLDDAYMGHFKFAEDGEEITFTEGEATHIVPHLYSNQPYFDYNADTQKYYRSEYAGRSAGPAQIDQTTGEQLAVDNVIIQYCPIQPYDDHGYLDVDTNYGGDAILFTRGTYQHATWEKASDWGPAKYYDENGEEIAINQGQTWVCVVQDTKAGDTSFE